MQPPEGINEEKFHPLEKELLLRLPRDNDPHRIHFSSSYRPILH